MKCQRGVGAVRSDLYAQIHVTGRTPKVDPL